MTCSEFERVLNHCAHLTKFWLFLRVREFFLFVLLTSRNEGYPIWWHLTNMQLVDEPIPCRGNVGMWQLPKEVAELICQ